MSWIDEYSYRQQVAINATPAGEQTNYQMKLTVHKGVGDSSSDNVYLKNHALSWTGTVPNDIRFTKSDGKTLLDYWIESSDADSAIVWIEFDTIPAEGSGTFYIYYGKAEDSSASDSADTFLQWHGSLAPLFVSEWHMSNILTPPVMVETIVGSYHDWCEDFWVGVSSGGSPRYPPKPDNCVVFIGRQRHDLPGHGRTRKDTNETTSGDYDTLGDESRRFKVLWLADEAKFWYDENNYQGSIGSNIPTTPLGLMFYSNNTTYKPNGPWIFARRYAEPEPTWGDWGEEREVGELPTLTTESASKVSPTEYTLNGILTDGGGEACDCGFEWGLTDSYGETTPTESKTTGEPFSQVISGLTTKTTYHFRAFATNFMGTSYGEDKTFITIISPTATTEAANNLTQVQSNLNGVLTDDGAEVCDCWFEWGLTDSYGEATDIQSGKTTGDVISQIISGLEVGTLYHFRFAAKNSAGTDYGDDKTFMTEGPTLEEYSPLQKEILPLLLR